jgi:Xaa-Pro aminopeptidase
MTLGNQAQDILTAAMVPGHTGNDVLRAARARAAEAGVNATFYAHAIGLHGHAAGPTIGLWDQQEGVSGAGDYPLHEDTAYSIELSVVHEVSEWGGQAVAIMLEEDARLDGTGVHFFDDRQRELWLI